MHNFFHNRLNELWKWANNIPKKIILFIFWIILLFCIDSFFWFSFHYKIHNELTAIEKIYSIEGELTPDLKSKVSEIENKILSHKYLLDYISYQITKIDIQDLLLFLSINWLLLVVWFILPFLEIKPHNKRFITILIVEFVIIIMMIIFYQIMILIPKFNKDVTNYLINIMISVLVFYLLSKWDNKK